MEMPLVAEGLRKLAMLARLISTGVLLEKGYLFWDEPETNLNPKLIKVVARSILTLCQQGIQVFIATHSLFLMRELEIILQEQPFRAIAPRYFALKASDAGAAMTGTPPSSPPGPVLVLDVQQRIGLAVPLRLILRGVLVARLTYARRRL